MKNRFLAHEIYEEDYVPDDSQELEPDEVDAMPGMALFRKTMFKRLVPNLRDIGPSHHEFSSIRKDWLSEFVHLSVHPTVSATRNSWSLNLRACPAARFERLERIVALSVRLPHPQC